MQTDNFDMSSAGVSLGLRVFLDTDLGRIEFEENFHVIQYSGYRTNCQLFYTDSGQVEFEGGLLEYYKLPENISAKELFSKWLEFSGYHVKEELEGLKHHVGFSSVRDKKLQDISTEIVAGYIKDRVWSKEELAEWYEQAGFESSLDVVGVYGYSQGDYAEVYFLPDHSVSSDFAQKLIYSAPVYCALDVDGETYHLDDGLNDRYSYDKEEIIEAAKSEIEHSQLPYILEWLEKNLPEHPDYC